VRSTAIRVHEEAFDLDFFLNITKASPPQLRRGKQKRHPTVRVAF